jgi:hypothetical protein
MGASHGKHDLVMTEVLELSVVSYVPYCRISESIFYAYSVHLTSLISIGFLPPNPFY